MAHRIPMCFRAVLGLAVMAAIGSARADDPTTVKQLQDTVAKLEKKIADLEAKVAALEKQAKAEPATKNDEEYVKTMAGALLDSLQAGDVPGMRNKLTKNMEQGIENLFKAGRLHDDEVDKWVKSDNPLLKYQAHTIDKIVFAPGKEHIVVTGTVTGKEAKAAFSMTLMKDGNKFLIDAIAVKAK